MNSRVLSKPSDLVALEESTHRRAMWAAASVAGCFLILAAPSLAQPLFTDATGEVGINLLHSRCIAFGDYDNDGRLDLYQNQSGRERRIGLRHNEGGGRFSDRTSLVQRHIPAEKRKGGGSIFGDYDNDGDLDLFVPVGSEWATDAARNVLLRNDRGTFSAVSHEAGLLDSLPTDLAIWLDYDHDGFLDLYTANQGWHSNPELYDPTPRNILYHNNGDGTFSKTTEEAGLEMQFHPDWGGSAGGGLVSADFNDDGWVDLYVGSFGAPNHLFLNDGRGRFRDAPNSGVGDPGGSFGLAVGDIDNDGDIPNSRSLKFLNLGGGEFLDVTEGIGLADLNRSSHAQPVMGDFDNDGDIDLIVVPLRLFLNNGVGNFTEVTEPFGVADSPRGGLYMTIGDYTGDGFLDVSTGIGLSRNNGNDNHFLRVELVGVQSNRDGIGARVNAISGDLTQTRQILGGLGFVQEERIAHFGLGSRTRVDRLEIRWPSGQVTMLQDLPVDRQIRVIEGRTAYHVVRPTAWETTPPAGLAAGSTTRLALEVRPALFEAEADITRVTADLSAFGGQQAAPLSPTGKGTYRLETILELDEHRSLREVSIDIEQTTSLGSYWAQLSREIAVAAPTDLELFGDTVANGGSVEGMWLNNLSQHEALDVLLWWWPDGQRVGFQSYREENWEIYAMDVDGSNIVNLTNFGANESDGSLSPDGTKIVFQSDRDGSNEIYLMNADGTDLVRLTEDTSPSWSPDGRRIVFVSNRDGNQEVYVMDADGSNPVNLTNHSFTDAGPSFSPDGTRIVFSSSRDNPGAVQTYTMNADGSNVVRLIEHSQWHGFPRWSPDGRRIAFSSTRNGGFSELYVMDADGSNIVRLTHHPAWDGVPRWSPDGRKIAILSTRDNNWEIYIVELDAADRVVLNPDERDVVYEGQSALRVETAAADMGESWKVLYRAEERLDLLGYKTLRFAFHPGDLEIREDAELLVALGESRVDLLGAAPKGRGIDIDQRAWQVVELPLSFFEVKVPIDGVAFAGNLAGTFYLHDVRLLTAVEVERKTAVEDEKSSTPATFALDQNYPNPFNSGTVINFDLPSRGETELTVYNLAGQKVVSLVEGVREAGNYHLRWDGRDDVGWHVASGVYFYRLRAGDQVETRKLLLLR